MSSLTPENNNPHDEEEEDEELDMSTLVSTRAKEESPLSKTTRKSISFDRPVATVMVSQQKEHSSEQEVRGECMDMSIK